MTTINFGNTCLPIHEAFHRSRARERIAYGAVGSGKSYALCDEAIAWCFEQPGIHGMITRKTAPELRDSTEKAFAERVPPELWTNDAIRRTGGHLESFTFPNGSRIIFRSMDDWKKHKSLNLGFIAWDEMSEFDEDTYNGMLTRLRQRDPLPEARAMGYTDPIRRQGTWGVTNPEGHDWVWRIGHPESPSRRKNIEAFFSTTLDNPYLPVTYVEEMLAMPEHFVKRYVLCQFDEFNGLIYEEFNWDDHTCAHPNWREMHIEQPMVWMGMDPGTQNPTAGLWVWQDPESRVLTGIAEYELADLAVDSHVRAWRSLEARQRMNVRWRVADPNAITQRDRGTVLSLQTQYSKLGYHFQLGAADRQARIMALGRLIHLHRFKLSRECMKTYDAIKNYQWRDLSPAALARGEEPKEEPLKRNTHLVECAQFIAGREIPTLPLKRRQKPVDYRDAMRQEVHGQIRKNLRAKRRVSRSPDTAGLV